MLLTFLAMTLAAAVPVDSPGNWISTDDYPEEALSLGLEGIVEFRLSVSKGGVVSDCSVIQSSNHKILDDQTCSLLTERARFYPAQTSSNYESRVSWQLPKMTLETNGIYAVASLGADGAVFECTDGAIGMPNDTPELCEGFNDPEFLNNLLQENRYKIERVELRMFMNLANQLEPATFSTGDHLMRFELVRADFSVDSAGHGRDCLVHSTKITPPDFMKICETFDPNSPDFVSDLKRLLPVAMQIKVELIVTPRAEAQQGGGGAKN